MASIINATTTAGVSVAGDNSGSLQLATNNGTTALTIDTSQNVGIGTSSPSEKLSVTGNVTATGTNTSATYFHRSIAPATESNIETSLITTGNGANQRAGLFANNDYNNTLATELIFKTNATTGGATERMRINSSGQLLISTSTVYNTATTNVGFVGNVGSGISVNTTTATNGATFQVFLSTGTLIGSISNNNNTGVSYNTTSDYRLKENIAPMTGALAVVQQLKPVTYTWKSTGEASQGFIAHELQEIVPDCVTGKKDAVETYTDENGNEQIRIKPQGIDTSFLVATLTAAIQELKAELDATKAEVQALKGVA